MVDRRQMVHRYMSEDVCFQGMLGIDVSAPPRVGDGSPHWHTAHPRGQQMALLNARRCFRVRESSQRQSVREVAPRQQESKLGSAAGSYRGPPPSALPKDQALADAEFHRGRWRGMNCGHEQPRFRQLASADLQVSDHLEQPARIAKVRPNRGQ